jgi:phosphate/sulfate permease
MVLASICNVLRAREVQCGIHHNIKGDVMGLPGMVLSAISTVTGAIMYWAMTAQSSSAVQSHGLRLSTIGVILMVAGVFGFIASLAVFISSRRSPSAPSRTFDREVVDSSGHRTVQHEEQT